MQSSRYLMSFSDDNSTGCSNRQACQNPVEKCAQIFLRFDVNRDKSDVMTSFGMIDWSDVCRIFRQACSLLERNPVITFVSLRKFSQLFYHQGKSNMLLH
jgi:hypothetical protein